MKKLKSSLLITTFAICLFSLFLLCACKTPTSIDGLAFEGANYVYDGTPKTISVAGVPEGATVVYDTSTTYKDAGVYPVTATVTTSTGDKIVLKSTLIITKAKYDMSGISFDSKAFAYSGESKSIEINGTLPKGVTVSYEGNGKSEEGTHKVIAKFISTDNNYEAIPDMVSSYVIYNATGLPSYEIIFDSKGGSNVENQNVLHGGLISQPQNPTKTDYSFDGWYYNDNLWSFNYQIVDKNITLVAKWKSVYSYTENENGGITVTGYSGNDSKVVFPETIDGLTVTEIGHLSLSPSVTSITIPKTVKKINEYAFSSKENLTDIIIPNGVEYIGNDAFGGCTSLKSIVIPGSVKIIGDGAFYGCTTLESIEIGDGAEIIGKNAFYSCTNLKNIIIPNSVRELGMDAFDKCDSLEYKTEKNIRYLGTESNPYLILVQGFDTAATSISINSNVKFICNGAFKNFSQITSVSIPSGVTSIGAGAFEECIKLVSVNIPKGVTKICKYTFSGCEALNSITLPDGITEIEDNAFSSCESLKTIAIPDNVKVIGDEAFYSSGLTSINIGINSKLEIIGEGAFQSTKITSFYIPKFVKKLELFSLDINLFEDCVLIIAKDSQLESIDSYATENVTAVFYGGNAEDWFNISIDDSNSELLTAPRYYYSETKPTESGNYWYYDEITGKPVIW